MSPRVRVAVAGVVGLGIALAVVMILRSRGEESATSPTPAPSTTAATQPAGTSTPTQAAEAPTAGSDALAPVIQIVSPSTGTAFETGASVVVHSLAADSAGVSRVDLLVDSTVVASTGAAKGEKTLASEQTWVAAAAGNQDLVVVAYDWSGRPSATDKTTVVVTKSESPPTVAIVRPTGPTEFEGGTYATLDAVAYDESGVVEMELLVDGASFARTPSSVAGGETTMTTTFSGTPAKLGAHTLVVRAKNTAGLVGESPPLQVTVVDKHTPVVSLAASPSSPAVDQLIDLSTNAVDSNGVVKVELLRNGQVVDDWVSGDKLGQVSVFTTFSRRESSAGSVTYMAQATDSTGNVGSSAALVVNVVQASAPTAPPPTAAPQPTAGPTFAPPSAAILSPVSGFELTYPSSFPTSVDARAHASAGLSTVALWGYLPPQYAGQQPTLLAEQNASGTDADVELSFPLPVWWRPVEGPLSLFVVATDTHGSAGRSPPTAGMITIATR